MTAPGDDDAPPPPLMTSPWVWESGDYREKIIRISVGFDPITRLVLSVQVYRDPDCVYGRVYIGLGADGTPNSTINTVPVPIGNTSIGAAPLRRNGLSTIDDILKLQITAGP